MLKLGDAAEKQQVGRITPLRKSTFGDVTFGGFESRGEPESPSLMDQMVAEAMTARQGKAQEERRDQRRESKASFRGGGLKKGFLTSSSVAGTKVKKKSKVKAPKCGAPSSIQTSATNPLRDTKNSTLTTTTLETKGAHFDVSADKGNHNPGLIFPEVQEAIKHSTSPLGGIGEGSGWLTPELLDKISENPRLAAMLTHPRFAEAMQLMSSRPKDAIAMFASSPEARDSFTELMALLAEHFTVMGKAADNQAAAVETERLKVAQGPLAQEALRRAAEGVGVAAMPGTAEDKARVDRVLNQPELRELLVDPSMQKVLQECADPALLARYMGHPEYGPKLRLMAQAGLVAFK